MAGTVIRATVRSATKGHKVNPGGQRSVSKGAWKCNEGRGGGGGGTEV